MDDEPRDDRTQARKPQETKDGEVEGSRPRGVSSCTGSEAEAGEERIWWASPCVATVCTRCFA